MKRIRFRHKQAQYQQPKDIFLVNEKIRFPELRVIDENNQMLGVMPTYKALQIAKEREYDLVAVSPKAQPPVAKLLNYGNFKYQQEKVAKKQKAQQRTSEVKEIRISPRIGKHDLDVRIKQAAKFFKKGDKLQIISILKGRERLHPELAKQVIDDFIKTINDELIKVKIEQEVKRQGNKFFAIIYPDPNADKIEPKEKNSAEKLDENKKIS